MLYYTFETLTQNFNVRRRFTCPLALRSDAIKRMHMVRR
jgi:hypothetical protein